MISERVNMFRQNILKLTLKMRHCASSLLQAVDIRNYCNHLRYFLPLETMCTPSEQKDGNWRDLSTVECPFRQTSRPNPSYVCRYRHLNTLITLS